MAGHRQLTLADLPFDVLELVALALTTGGDACAVAHLAATCRPLRAAACSALARLTRLAITPNQVVALIPRRCQQQQQQQPTTTATRPPTPAELERAAPLVASLLRHCTSAEAIDFSRGHAYVTDAVLDAAAAAAGPALKDVDLSYCARVTAPALARLGAAAPGLAALSLAAVPAAGEPGVLDGFTALADLDVSWVRAFGGGRQRRPLARAALRGCEGVGDEAVAALLSPSLSHLDIAFTSVSDAGLAAVAAAAPGLATLVIASSETTDAIWSLGFFTGGGLRRFRAAAPRVQVLLVAS